MILGCLVDESEAALFRLGPDEGPEAWVASCQGEINRSAGDVGTSFRFQEIEQSGSDS
jgi:hypothetical protein